MKKGLLYVTAIALMMVVSCKKYSEGGLSLRVKKHLHGGIWDEWEKQWEVTLYQVNGIDSTASFKKGQSQHIYSYYDVVIKNGKANDNNFTVETELNKYTMTLENKKTEVTFQSLSTADTVGYRCLTNGICERSIFMPEGKKGPTLSWKILRSKNKEFIITATGINTYKITLTAADE